MTTQKFTLSVMFLLVSFSPALSEGTTLYVKNKTSGYITVNVDGSYGCNTAAGTTCSIPVSVGTHNLHAHRGDTGDTTEKDQTISSSGYTWTPWSQ